ncbi:hypothetical protein ABZP36_033429 [Zizania latifolia]
MASRLPWGASSIPGIFAIGDVAAFPLKKDAKEEIQLFLGNAGTAIRPLTAAVTVAGGNATYVLDGVPRMRERLIHDLVVGLKQLGADVDCFLGTDCPPVCVNGIVLFEENLSKTVWLVCSRYRVTLLNSGKYVKHMLEQVEGNRSVLEREVSLEDVMVFSVNWLHFCYSAAAMCTLPGVHYIHDVADADSLVSSLIVLTVAEHHSAIVPWQFVSQKTGATLKYVGLTKEEVPDIEQLKGLLSNKTKIVFVHHVSNVLDLRLEHLQLEKL